MKDNSERQPPFPELLNCHCSGENCAWTGCFFKNALERIDSAKLGEEKAEEVKGELLSMAADCGCKNLNNLIK